MGSHENEKVMKKDRKKKVKKEEEDRKEQRWLQDRLFPNKQQEVRQI